MAAPSLASVFRVVVRRVDGGIIFRPKRHDISRPSAAKMRSNMDTFSTKMTGKKISVACRGKKGRSFWSCLRSKGSAAWRGTA